jgi:tyramine---L-glutamate ligase
MRLFVYEWSCCCPAEDDLAALLRLEGWAMLSAVLTDLARVPGVEVITLLARDHPPVPFPCCRVSLADEEQVFREQAALADHSLVIAPELGGILAERCRWAVEAGGSLLGPTLEAVRLASDKLALATHLQRRGVPTPWTRLLNELLGDWDQFPAICKPRDGAGSESIFLVETREELRDRYPFDPPSDLIIQPFVPGTAASVACLVGPRQRLPLLPALQFLSVDGRFRYLGGRAPLSPDLADRARRLALAAVDAVPGLHAYVGVDLVLGPDPDGREDQVIEINPRWTTSYVGLRVLARENLAATLLAVARGEKVPELTWEQGSVVWEPDGQVRPE